MLASPWRSAVYLALSGVAVSAASARAANQPSRSSGLISRQAETAGQPSGRELDRPDAKVAEQEKKRRQLAVQYCMRGMGLMKARKYERAIADFETASRLEPECPGTDIGRGICLEKLRRKKEAQQAFVTAVRRNPDNADTRYWLGFSLCESGDLDGAIEQLDASIKIDAKSAKAFAARAEAWSQKGDYRRAISDAETAILLEPDDFAVYAARAQIENRAGHYREAREDSDRAMKLAPANAKVVGRTWWALLRLEQIANPGRKNEKQRSR